MIVKSSIAQIILDRLLSGSPDGWVNKISYKIWRTLRGAVVTFAHDPAVTYHLAGSDILLPLSHDLPIFRKIFPNYSSNVARIARDVRTAYPELTFIDIGANVGDTVAFLRAESDFPIICIDGNETFFSFLEHNAAAWHDVTLVKAFVGEQTGSFAGSVKTSGGTSQLTDGGSLADGIPIVQLSRILADNPRFGRSKMIKLDTDGFDCKIINAERALLAELRPVLFFEYAPYLSAQLANESFSVFETLRQAGYRSALVYDNTGEYMLAAELDNVPLLEDIHHYFSRPGTQRYCDICAFHEDDTVLGARIRISEMRFFETQKNEDLL